MPDNTWRRITPVGISGRLSDCLESDSTQNLAMLPDDLCSIYAFSDVQVRVAYPQIYEEQEWSIGYMGVKVIGLLNI